MPRGKTFINRLFILCLCLISLIHTAPKSIQPFCRNNGYKWPCASLVLMVSLNQTNNIPNEEKKYVALLLHREEQLQASAAGSGKVYKWMTK